MKKYLIILAVWFGACSPIEEELIYSEPQRVLADAFPTLNGNRSYIQHVYLDTLSSFTYTQIYAESTDMAESQKYNGEANIHARFSTNLLIGLTLMVYSLIILFIILILLLFVLYALCRIMNIKPRPWPFSLSNWWDQFRNKPW
jgi:hypothetical protein